IFFFALLLSAAVPSSGDYLKFPLVHTTPYPPSPSEALAADNRRLSDLSKRSHPRLPVISAASSGSGQYLVTLHLGSPPQRLFLVADTGSDLTWVSCSACSRQCSGRAAAGFFPRRSSSFSPYHCFDSECSVVPRPKQAARCNHTRLHSACRYEYSYSDGSVTRGFFSHETMEFNTSAGKLERFSHLSFGCGFSNIPGPNLNGPNGVLGLGRGPISFFTQMGQVFGHKFSYCLKDYTLSPPPTSYLLIGGGSSVVTEQRLSYTKLLTNPLSPTFYYVKIDGVIVNGVKLPISPSVWSIDELGNGGTVLDSGTTLTYLAPPAYREILAAFQRLVEPPGSARRSSGFDFCLNTTSGSGATLPRLSFELDGGSDYSPPPRNYFIDTPEGVTCLAVRPVTSAAGFSVIGNLMQQGFTFEFDRDLGRVGYTRSGCGAP
ncbi:hypothetical protein M569_14077, partial [Genlisea aurea]